MRLIGLDFGSKTIGVAVSDEMGWTAQPLTVISRRGVEKDVAAVADLVAEYEAQTVVLGLPRNMDGSLGPMAEKAQAFGRRLAEVVAAEVEFWDERLSTVTAERILIQGDVSRKKRKQVVDKLAAAIILQTYLDYRSARGETGPGDER